MRRLAVPAAFAVVIGSASALRAQSLGMISQTFAPDARGLGMHHAFTAIAVGPATAFWNPAGLGVGDGVTFEIGTAPYVQLAPGLSDDVVLRSASVVARARRLGIGFNLNHIDYGADALEYTIHAGLGAEVARRQPEVGSSGPDVRLSLGANLKVFHAEFPASPIPLPDAVVGDLSGTAADMDAGVLAVARWYTADAAIAHDPPGYVGLRLGIVVSNALDREIDFGNGSDPLGRSLRTGVAIETQTSGRAVAGPLMEARATLEAVSFFGRVDGETAFRYGFELVTLGLLSIRTGCLVRDDVDDEETVGFGIAWQHDDRFGARLDAANLPSASDFPAGSRTHYGVSVWSRFGAQPAGGS